MNRAGKERVRSSLGTNLAVGGEGKGLNSRKGLALIEKDGVNGLCCGGKGNKS